MKVVTWMVLGALALGTAGCGGCSTILPSGSALKVDQSLYVAEAAFQGANLAAEQGVQTGLLKPGSANAVLVANDLTIAKTALDSANAARKVSDARTEGDQILAAQKAVAAVMAAIQPKGN